MEKKMNILIRKLEMWEFTCRYSTCDTASQKEIQDGFMAETSCYWLYCYTNEEVGLLVSTSGSQSWTHPYTCTFHLEWTVQLFVPLPVLSVATRTQASYPSIFHLQYYNVKGWKPEIKYCDYRIVHSPHSLVEKFHIFMIKHHHDSTKLYQKQVFNFNSITCQNEHSLNSTNKSRFGLTKVTPVRTPWVA